MRYERSAGFIIYRTDGSQREYLLLQHSEHGHWDFPKGLIEPGEDEITTATRELEEETSISPSSIHIERGFKEQIEYYYFFQGERINKTVILFLAETSPSQSVRISTEHTDATWFSFNEAIEHANFENTRRVLQHAESLLQDTR